ncbi:UTP--glucose-1-phosphate uridylyltransferase GalU [Inmirania thermothiophila]|uniref:UTP--glucose-1-phosphate uridylyltransferase n=1 Tax=Inmirania thermothiophila TaxID=1750597 RepID=A0A3N1Y1Z0_9GAMM|nr:UTP--glucose-1-phosphate uridylyltransferase GalU [Inmirania thermothiophila]ROR32829.1 UDP-glucose pyrophosphorylase [Inmirania thermothiophila]
MKVRKAVFPVAGLGTRFLPATKASPKEMLPVVDKPLIQYAAEEAVAAGISELIFVTSSAKRAIEDHFDKNFELEVELERRGKHALLEQVRRIVPAGVSCVYVRQPEALGLGHAVLCARQVVGEEPFAVILADDLIDGGDRPVLAQMVEAFEREGASILAVEEVDPEETHKYGVVKPEGGEGALVRIRGIVEKPHPEVAPSNLAVVGRYVLTPRILDLLEHTERGAGGEIQLTDAIAELLHHEPVFAYRYRGRRYDCGSKLGYLEATVEYGLRHPELGEDFRRYLAGRCPGL